MLHGIVAINSRVFGCQAEKVHELNEEIGKLLAKAEQLGAEGNVDEAQKVLQEVEKVRTKKKDAEVRQCFYDVYFVNMFPSTSCHISFIQNITFIILVCNAFWMFVFYRKSTGTLCPPPVSSSRSCVSVRFAPRTWVFMTTTGVLLTTLVANCTWASSRSERSWSS